MSNKEVLGTSAVDGAGGREPQAECEQAKLQRLSASADH